MRRTVLLLLATALVVGLLPGAALASTTEAIAETGGATLELGLPGSPVNFTVHLDEFGNLVDLEVSDGTTVTPTDEHKIRFANADGTTRVDVKAKKSKLSMKVKTADAAGVIGDHIWSADVFGTGDVASVGFAIAMGTSGYPELTSVSDPTGLPADATFTVGAIENKMKDDEFESEAKVTFMFNGYTKTLKIEVETEFATEGDDDDDHDLPVTLKTELKGKDEQKLREATLASLLGQHMWDGLLCDGTQVAATFTVNADGTVTLDSVSGVDAGAYSMEAKDHGFEIRFDGTDAKVKVELKQKDDGSWELKVKSKTTEKCDKDDDHDKSKDDDHDKSKDDDHKDDHHDDDHGDDHSDD